MSSATPSTDLWLERSRLNGMLLGAVTYGKHDRLFLDTCVDRSVDYPCPGIYFLLTVQSFNALLRKPRSQSNGGKTKRTVMLTYVIITFILATIGFAGNAKYTQMIWIDLRDAPGGPAALIDLELNYWINRMALARCAFPTIA